MISKQVTAVARSRFSLAEVLNTLLYHCRKDGAFADTHIRRAQFHSKTVKVPQMAESISEGTLRSWSKQVGHTVEADEVATIETDKIDVSVNALSAGKIVELLAKEEDTVSVGQDLFIIEPGEGGGNLRDTSHFHMALASAAPEESKTDPEEPRDQQLDKTTPKPRTPSAADKQSPPEGTQRVQEGEDKSKALISAPKAPGNRGETRIDMSSLMEMRKKYKDEVLKEHDVKLGFMSAFAHACALALKEIPAANASIEGDEIVYYDFVDLSVAVATPKGLVTPVVRNVEDTGFVEIEKEIAALGNKARDGKLTLEDMAGDTFTISNGGVFGSLYGTPIINLPQSAVLGMHAIKDKPVVVNGQIVIRPIMVVALTYDHRLLDGREAVTFLVKVRDYIEDPRKMLLASS
ncbi:hypothetical protein DFJ58DRAFT_880191 [Suillus subalutaceus]|uniref:uncharacterized protein n=1 Tax=Suillus subalutaceus TaxID=48586 RepID=UPI001B87326F|nr:uncharacterized protein DFJ58DRAFT_880191 [Suillus subalutaceus]KAG1855693.1 hypothetical protein DFJ58DRAFT_880191 [Suillus subalutaceus]